MELMGGWMYEFIFYWQAKLRKYKLKDDEHTMEQSVCGSTTQMCSGKQRERNIVK